MATLIHKTTGQVMADIANVQAFLGAVSDPDQWESDDAQEVAPAATQPVAEQPETVLQEIEQKAEEVVAPVESVLASAVHSVEAGLETILHKIEGEQQ